MAIRADSYSSLAAVTPFVRYMLKGEPTFTDATLPTKTEVEGMIDDVSGVLNAALSGGGFTVPFNSTNANSTAVLSCDNWTKFEVASQVEATQIGPGLGDLEGSRVEMFKRMNVRAIEFVESFSLGWKYLGAAVGVQASDGLQYTGLKARDQRADPDDVTLEQPSFRRHKFSWQDEEGVNEVDESRS